MVVNIELGHGKKSQTSKYNTYALSHKVHLVDVP